MTPPNGFVDVDGSDETSPDLNGLVAREESFEPNSAALVCSPAGVWPNIRGDPDGWKLLACSTKLNVGTLDCWLEVPCPKLAVKLGGGVGVCSFGANEKEGGAEVVCVAWPNPLNEGCDDCGCVKMLFCGACSGFDTLPKRPPFGWLLFCWLLPKLNAGAGAEVRCGGCD